MSENGPAVLGIGWSVFFSNLTYPSAAQGEWLVASPFRGVIDVFYARSLWGGLEACFNTLLEVVLIGKGLLAGIGEQFNPCPTRPISRKQN